MALKDSIQEVINMRLQHVEDAIKAKLLVELLPAEVQGLSGQADCGTITGELRLALWANRDGGVDVLKVLKMAGVQGLQVKHGSYGKDAWHARGEAVLPNGVKVNVGVYGLEAPVNCKVEEYTEQVTRYRAICEETGQEV